jgi:hypothetical protein
MPLDPEFKKQYLAQMGLDPEKYHVEEIEDTPEAPPKDPKMGVGQAVLSRVKRAIFPSGAALAGAGYGAELGSPLGPFGSGVGALLGGGLSSYLAQKGQEKGLQYLQTPENYQSGLNEYIQAQEQHPMASLATDVGAALVGQKPSITGFQALKKLPFAGAVKLSNAEKAGLTSMGVNAGLGAGLDVGAQKLIEGRDDIDWARVAANAAGQGMMSELNPLGRLAFRRRNIIPERVNDAPVLPPVNKERPIAGLLPERTGAIELPDGSTPAAPNRSLTEIDQRLKESQVKPTITPPPPIPKGLIPEEVTPSATYRLRKQFPRLPIPKQENSTLGGGVGNDISELAQRRGVNLTQDKWLANDQSRAIAGQADILNRESTINPNKAGADTAPHEVLGHQFVEDLLASTNPKDKAFAEAGLKLAGGDKEVLADMVGKRFVDIQNKPLRSYFQDLYSRWIGGKNAEANILTRKGVYDKPFAEDRPLVEGAINRINSQEDTNIHYSDTPSPESNTKLNHLQRALLSVTDRLRAEGPEGARAADAVEAFETDKTRLYGKFVNKGGEILRQVNQTGIDIKNLGNYLSRVRHGVEAPNPQIEAAIKPLRDLLVEVHNEQRSRGLLIDNREAIDNPTWTPEMPAVDVVKELTEHPNSPESAKLTQDLRDFGYSQDEVVAYKNALSAATKGATEFGALRKAEGRGLPLSWQEKDFSKILNRYMHRSAQDLAFWTNIQSKPEIRTILNISHEGSTKNNPLVDSFGRPIKAVGGNSAIAARNTVTGNYRPESLQFKTLETGLRAGVLGTTSAAANHFSSYIQMLPYVPLKYLPEVIKGWGYVKEGLVHSLEKGVNRRDITSLEVGDYFGGSFSDFIKRATNLVRTAQGYKHIEYITRGHNMAAGELLAKAMWGKARAGGKDEMAFFNKFGKGLNIDFSQPPTPHIIQEVAANFVERVQGSYNTKGLPHWLVEPSSWAYWFMNLSKWAVERSNIFYHDIYQPASQGEFGPILRYTVGALLGGAAIRQIREVMNHKKQETPTLAEAGAAESPRAALAYTVNALQLAGWAGMLTDTAKIVTDIASGSKPRTPNIVSVDFLVNGLVGNLKNFSDAVQNGQPVGETGLKAINEMLLDYIQSYRLIANQTTRKEDNERSDMYRDLRNFRKFQQGKIIGGGADQPNPLLNTDEKTFKRTKDFEEAKGVLRQDILPRVRQLKLPEREQRLKALRRNPFEITPSQQGDLRDYMEYLDKSQGQGSGKARLQFQRKQEGVNRRKSAIVPSR